MEMSELARHFLIKLDQWNLPGIVAKLDISRAFDAMTHNTIINGLRATGVPGKLILAIMRELTNCSISLKFRDLIWSGLPYQRGGKQGGSETPEVWKRVLDATLKCVVPRWRAAGLGITFGDQCLSYHAWADDLIVLATSAASFREMLGILCEELSRDGLAVKDGSIEILVAGNSYASECTWTFPSCSHVVHFVETLDILGIRLDPVGSSRTSVEHRISQAWVHFHSRSKVLCSRSISRNSRVRRLRETVFRTLLHGSGGWHYTTMIIHMLDAFETKVLQLMLAPTRRPDECDKEFFSRTKDYCLG
jgi:hypothetical protein